MGEDRWLMINRRNHRRGKEHCEVGFSTWRPRFTYSHELLHLLPLHAGGELALFRCVKSGMSISGYSKDDGKPMELKNKEVIFERDQRKRLRFHCE